MRIPRFDLSTKRHLCIVFIPFAVVMIAGVITMIAVLAIKYVKINGPDPSITWSDLQNENPNSSHSLPLVRPSPQPFFAEDHENGTLGKFADVAEVSQDIPNLAARNPYVLPEPRLRIKVYGYDSAASRVDVSLPLLLIPFAVLMI